MILIQKLAMGKINLKYCKISEVEFSHNFSLSINDFNHIDQRYLVPQLKV